MIDSISMLGVNITNISEKELNEMLVNSTRQNKKYICSNVNIHAMNLSTRHLWFRRFLNEAKINFCDGDGVRLGALIKGFKIKEKITYNRWIWSFAEVCAKNKLSWYLVGSHKHVVDKAKSVLERKAKELNIVGCHHGFIDKDFALNKALIEDISEKKPNILIVGMGMPMQEKWLKSNFDILEFNVALPAGAVFEYVSGEAKMTPNIFYSLKLEWLYRFLQDPKRLFSRYFIGNPSFILRVLLEKFGLINYEK